MCHTSYHWGIIIRRPIHLLQDSLIQPMRLKKAYAPYLFSFRAFAIASGIICVAGKIPNPPPRQPDSENLVTLSGRQYWPYIILGTVCQLWPLSTAGVEWSPVTTMTSGCKLKSSGNVLSVSSNIFTLRSKSPSSPAASSALMCTKKKSNSL